MRANDHDSTPQDDDHVVVAKHPARRQDPYP
jgi:hypothetical protein